MCIRDRDEAAALSQRLLDLTGLGQCPDILSLPRSAETYDCSRECEDAVRADGAFHVCEAESARGFGVGAPPLVITVWSRSRCL